MTIKFDIRNRWTGEVQFTAEIDCAEDAPRSLKLGLAVRWALNAGASLVGADLARADLVGANLAGANLVGADLAGANLVGANLVGADLARANLARANLARANLAGANLVGANLAGADLAGANLARANLARANLVGADLARAYLAGANLARANGAELAIAKTRILPAGSLIGWKKCRNNVIVKLRIPEDAPRSHAFGRKCRAQFADVLEVTGSTEAVSSHDSNFIYRAGERVTATNWSDNWQDECAGGVHFFITREEAEAY